MAKGMSPEQARREARIEMGGAEQIKEEVRGARAGVWIETVWQDLRSGARTLRKNPGFAATAILTLALGMGANTAVFSVVRAVLLSSLPYHEPDRLVKIWGQLTREGLPKNSFSDPECFELADTNQSFEQVAAYYTNSSANLGGDSTEAQRVTRGLANWTLFPLLGVQPILGRTFSAEEDQPGHDQVAVISYGLWLSFFAGDPNVAGKTMRMNNRPYTVIGVLPEGFNFGANNQVCIPLALDRNHPGNRGNHSWSVIGRLKSGITVAQASAEMARFGQRRAGVSSFLPAVVRLGRVYCSAARGISGADPARIAHSDGRGGDRAVDRLCEHRQPDAGAKLSTRKGNGRACIARGGPRSNDSPASHREPAAFANRIRSGTCIR